MPDPPLLRLESEAHQAYLAMLQHLPVDKPSLSKDVEVEARLVKALWRSAPAVHLNLYFHG